MALGLLILGGAALFLLFGTHTTVVAGMPTTVDPGASPGAQRIQAGQNTTGFQSTTAQNISAGGGNQVSQDISAIAPIVSGLTQVFHGFNSGGGATATTTSVPAGTTSPNDMTGGTQASNNYSGGASGPALSLNDPAETPVSVDYSNFSFGDDTNGIGLG